MKKLFFTFLILLFITSLVYAHSPNRIDADYDKETQTLFVVVKHGVSNPENHYIEKISIEAGDNNFLFEEFSRQSTNEQEVFKKEIPNLVAGDKILITANCVLYGKKIKEIIIE